MTTESMTTMSHGKTPHFPMADADLPSGEETVALQAPASRRPRRPAVRDQTADLEFKVADLPEELDRICELNYKTFVEEIPQHTANEEKVLVDKFHQQNTYVICKEQGEVVGMMAGRLERPFSLDAKLDNLDAFLDPGRQLLEIRLLSVEPGRRGTRICTGLIKEMLRFGIENGVQDVLISGTTRQLRLYHRLGFENFGPLVGTDPDAMFQPMRLRAEKLAEKAQQFGGLIDDELRDAMLEHYQAQGQAPTEDADAKAPDAKAQDAKAEAKTEATREEVTLLPGPVNIRKSVREAFKRDPVSHRAEFFVDEFQQLKRDLCKFVGCERTEILVGTGTMANDVVGGQIKLLDKPGLLLSNGEFGERLIDHATRLDLDFAILRQEWGEPLDTAAIAAHLDQNPDVGWLWCTHCETSTGILNPLEQLKELCKARDVKLCLDGVSSIAAVPVDLGGVYLCSGSSGKAIGGFPGLSMVFYHHEIKPSTRLPRYLDLGQYAANDGIAYTHSSNLVYALQEAVASFDDGFDKVASLSEWVRQKVEELGLSVVAPRDHASPAVITIQIPEGVSSKDVGDKAFEQGYLLSYMSGYLLRRNWVQICLMGDLPAANIEPLLATLGAMCTSSDAR